MIYSGLWVQNFSKLFKTSKLSRSFEMWCWRRMEKISCTDHLRYKDVLLRVKEQRNILKYVNGRRTGLVTFYVETTFYNGLLKER
jgi:hypothetical protein